MEKKFLEEFRLFCGMRQSSLGSRVVHGTLCTIWRCGSCISLQCTLADVFFSPFGHRAKEYFLHVTGGNHLQKTHICSLHQTKRITCVLWWFSRQLLEKIWHWRIEKHSPSFPTLRPESEQWRLGIQSY